MKKSILQFSVIAAIAASMTLTTSCSSDDSAEVYVPEPVVFNAGMSGLDINRAATRTWTTVGDQWAADLKVSVYTKDADDTYSTKTYVSDADAGTVNISSKDMHYTTLKGYDVATDPTNCFYWKTATETKTIRAWTYGTGTAPGDIMESSSLKTLTYELDGIAGSTQTNKELLYCYQDYAKGAANTASLIFNHQLSRVTIKIYAQKEELTKCTIGSSDNSKAATGTVPVKNTFSQPSDGNEKKGTNANGDWTAATFTTYSASTYGYITPQEASKNTTVPTGSELSNSADAAKYTKFSQYEAVVLPGDYKGKTLFEITYDGAVYAFIPPSGSAYNLDLGKHYTFQVVIKDAALEVYAAIAPWSTENKPAVDAVLQ